MINQYCKSTQIWLGNTTFWNIVNGVPKNLKIYCLLYWFKYLWCLLNCSRLWLWTKLWNISFTRNYWLKSRKIGDQSGLGGIFFPDNFKNPKCIRIEPNLFFCDGDSPLERPHSALQRMWFLQQNCNCQVWLRNVNWTNSATYMD